MTSRRTVPLFAALSVAMTAVLVATVVLVAHSRRRGGGPDGGRVAAGPTADTASPTLATVAGSLAAQAPPPPGQAPSDTVAKVSASTPPSAPPSRPPDSAAYDVIIEGGRIVDGTGNPWYRGDVGIRGDRIARIVPPGGLSDAPAGLRIDATGLVVSPGFIDIQSQSRYALLHGDGRVISKVTQGITSAILGEGTTDAPLNSRSLDLSSVTDSARRAELRSFSGPHGFDAWLRAMKKHGPAVNVGSFVGGATLRVYGRGYRMGAPTPAEVDTMQAAMRRAMEDGAFGLATALIYPPGSYATTDELVAIAQAMSPYGGVYITHLRSEADHLLSAVDEALEIGRKGGVPVEIYHLKAAGRRNWGKETALIQKIDSARAAGQDIQADMYPYTAGSTDLASCLPPWASAGGRLYSNLEDPDTRARIVREIDAGSEGWEDLCQQATPEGVLLLGLSKPGDREWSGHRLSEVAQATGKEWADALIDLILKERSRIGAVFFLASEDNVRLQLRQPWIKFGTDAGGVNPRAGLGLVHPRAYGTFPRIFGRYVRDEKVLTLEDAVRKATSAVATRLSIPDRGLLKEGFHADVTIFDPKTIADRATYMDPHQLSVGVRWVLVNGVPVLRNGRITGARPGQVLRGPGYRRGEPAPGR